MPRTVRSIVTRTQASSFIGEVAEWSKAHAWKACIPYGIEGSNPSLSANSPPISQWYSNQPPIESQGGPVDKTPDRTQSQTQI